jgi:hypothetical protein
MEGNQLVSKATWTFVPYMAIGQTLQTVEWVKQSVCSLGPVEWQGIGTHHWMCVRVRHVEWRNPWKMGSRYIIKSSIQGLSQMFIYGTTFSHVCTVQEYCQCAPSVWQHA